MSADLRRWRLQDSQKHRLSKPTPVTGGCQCGGTGARDRVRRDVLPHPRYAFSVVSIELADRAFPGSAGVPPACPDESAERRQLCPLSEDVASDVDMVQTNLQTARRWILTNAGTLSI